MNMKTSGLSVLIIGAGLWMCFAGPLRAAENDTGASDSTAQTEDTADVPDAPIAPKVVKHRAKKPAEAASLKSGKMASKALSARKTDDANAAPDDAVPSSIQTSVANANARLQAGDAPAANNALKTVSSQADNMLRTVRQADPVAAQTDAPAVSAEMVPADQLNEVDRTMSDDKAPAPTLSMAVAQTPYTTNNIDSTWNQTSLIGKIFVAFGGLLTVASAARMFMA
jgi:ribosomal protein S20